MQQAVGAGGFVDTPISVWQFAMFRLSITLSNLSEIVVAYRTSDTGTSLPAGRTPNRIRDVASLFRSCTPMGDSSSTIGLGYCSLSRSNLGQHARCYASSEKAMAELRPAMGNVEFDNNDFQTARS